MFLVYFSFSDENTLFLTFLSIVKMRRTGPSGPPPTRLMRLSRARNSKNNATLKVKWVPPAHTHHNRGKDPTEAMTTWFLFNNINCDGCKEFLHSSEG